MLLLRSFKQLRRFLSYKPGLLNDVTVLDVTRIVAGPLCTMTLGDLGANVIKVESLRGDESRRWGPPFVNNDKEKDSLFFMAVNRSKKSVCIDLKSVDGKQVFYDLAVKSSVMVENYVPGKLDSMDVGYKKLSNINPKLIYCSITGFGQKGPYKTKPNLDAIATAMGGLLNATGDKDGRPVKPAVALIDICTGLHAFGAIAIALYHRERTGKGHRINCNLFSTQISVMINLAANYLNAGMEPQRWGTEHASIVPYQAFQTSDGYMVFGTASNAHFADLCRLIGKLELGTDERFESNLKRVQNRDALVKIIGDAIKTKSKKEWAGVFKNAKFPQGPINTMAEVFDDEHVKSIGLVKEILHPDAGVLRMVGPPTEYNSAGNYVRSAPPSLGQHTREVLGNFLGYSNRKIDELFSNKIIR